MKHFTRIAMLLAMLFFVGESALAQTNLAPNATVSCSNPWNWNRINDQDRGSCGSQQAFVWTGNPPANSDYMQWVWSSTVGISQIDIYHAQTTGRFLTGGTVQRWTGSSWVDHYTFSGLNQSNCMNTISFPAFFSTRMRITKFRMNGTGQTSNPNFREIEIFLKIYGSNNAGISSIDPLSPCTPKQDIKATIGNFGTNRLDSVTVNYTINGVAQTPILYKTDTIGAAEEVKITLQNYTFSPNTRYTIKAWTTAPNGKTDTVNLNDTNELTFFFNGSPSAPTANAVSHCGIGEVDISATPDNVNDSLFWFTEKTGGSPFAVGKNVKSPFLYNSDTMWVNAFRRGSEDSVSNGLGGGVIVSANTGRYNGDMFDVTVGSAPISMSQLTISVWQNQLCSYEVYIRNGTYVGNQNSSAGWTRIASGVGTPYNANGQNNLIDIDLGNLLLPANTITGWYVTTTTTNGNDIYLTNGNAGVDAGDFKVTGGSAILGLFASGGGVYNTWTIDHSFKYAITCATSSGRVAVPIEIKRLPTGSEFTKGSTFQGVFRKGTFADPDRVAEDSMATYEMMNPTLFAGGDYGTTWNWSMDVRTPNGTIVPNWGLTDPTSSTAGVFSITPQQGWADSMLIATITISDLNNGCDTVFTRHINVAPIPRTDFSAPNACLGTPIEFRNLTSLSTGFATYLWEFGDGNTSTFIDPIHTYKAFGKYKVKLTVTSNWGVSKDTTIEIEVFEIPDIQFTVKHACEDENLTILNNTKISSGTISYVWNYGDGTGGNTGAASHNKMYAKPGGYTITLKATANGCESVATRNANQFARPTADFEATPDCIGSVTQFTNTSKIELNEKIGSNWWFGDGEVGTLNDPGHVYTTAGAKSVKLRAISQFGCADSITKNIVIKDGPIAGFTYDKACNVDPVNFTNTTSEPSGLTVIYAWDFGDGNNSTQKSPSHKYPGLGTYPVQLLATADNGCTSTFEEQIRVLIQPVADFEVADVCSDETAIFVNRTEAAGSVTYKWYFGDGDSSDHVAPTHLYPTTTQSYGVRLLAFVQDGCTDEITKTLNVHEAPDCGFTFTQSQADRTEFTFTPDNPNYSGEYIWTFKGSGNSTEKSPTKKFEYTETQYQVYFRIKTDDGCDCVDSSTVVLTSWGSVGGTDAGTVNVYPNPNNGTFSIDLEGWYNNASLTLRITDAQGRVVYASSDKDLLDDKKVLTLEGLARGVYNLEVAGDKSRLIKKIIVAD